MNIKHIAFIMDGNGRWAKERGKSRSFGHREGVKALKKIIEACNDKGIHVVSFFAFSTENWKRPKEERDKLFNLIKKFADNELNKYAKRNFRTNFMGDLTDLPEDVIKSINKVKKFTINNSGMIINIALNYGSRCEIIRACNNMLKNNICNITQEEFNKYLYSYMLPDPDVIVRTSGEKRLSNFMLYQAAYSELIFVDEYWPDFDEKSLDKVIIEYNNRIRRFGNV